MVYQVQNTTEKKIFLGEILIQRKLITQRQLDEALELQKKESLPVGEILLQQGHIQERDIVVALIIQCHLPYIAVEKYIIHAQVLRLIPKDIARKLLVIPIERVGDVLSVVMANPLDNDAKQQIEQLTGCQVSTFIATKTEVQNAIQHCYI